MLKKDAREPYKEIGVAQCFQGLRRFCFQTREYNSQLFYPIMYYLASKKSIASRYPSKP